MYFKVRLREQTINRSAVAKWLANWPMVLEIPGSMPAGGEKNLMSTPLRVICRDDMTTVRRLLERGVNWKPSMQEQSSPVQVTDPYTGSILMHVYSSC